MTKKCTLHRGVQMFSLTNFKNLLIILSGGSVTSGHASVYKVSSFNIKQNKWRDEPELNNKRRCHSSCSLGESVYVFAGFKAFGDYEGSVESLKVDAG